MKLFYLLCLSASLSVDAIERLPQQLEEITTALAVPGYAYTLTINGKKVFAQAHGKQRDGQAFTLDTQLRFASVTKALTGIALIQLEESGKLNLQDRLLDWDEGWSGPVQTTIAQVAAHTAEGEPGSVYIYSSGRYARLGKIIEKASGQSLSDYFCEFLLTPSKASCFDSPHLGAHAGLVSSVNQMSKVFNTLLHGGLLSNKGLAKLWTNFELKDHSQSPVGVGWFIQKLGGKTLAWSFGQDDPEHSGVRVIIAPAEKAVFVFLANSNSISDAYRLLGGDLRSDPIAAVLLSTLTHGEYVDSPYSKLSELLTGIYRQDIAAVSKSFQTLPAELDIEPSAPLVFAMSVMCSLDNQYANRALPVINKAVNSRPGDRWSLLFAAESHAHCGNPSQSMNYYQTILNLDNQEQDLIGRLFRAWSNAGLAKLIMQSNPQAALQYIEAGLATGVGGETREGLEALRQKISDFQAPD